MKTARQLINDESGMTMAFAVIMIAVLGVMGAALLTFVNRDLNTVLEENRGQRAFELADAGVEVAKRQLISDCVGNIACSAHYNGDGPPTEDDICGADDIQWSALRCDNPDGLTLENLDGDDGTTDGYAIVTIQYKSDTDDFRVISTGFYGEHVKRKIEAIFRGTAGGAGGGNIINPAYYAPSDVRLREDVKVSGISLFSEKNIIIEGLRPYSQCGPPAPPGIEEPNNPNSGSYPRDCLYAEYEKTGGVLTTSSNPGRAELGDWDSRKFFDNDVPDLTWNTVGRVNRKGDPEKGPGFAAEGLICGSSANCNDPSDSIAEGRYGYDSTTGTKGQGFRFAKKINCSTGIEEPFRDPNGTTCSTPAEDIITYPFERKAPDAAQLKQLALNTGSWYRGANPPWATLLGSGRRVVFIDAGGSTVPLTLDQTSGAAKGIIVVWCGSLNVNNLGSSGFKGIIMMLNGSSVDEELPLDPSGEASSSCGPEQGTFSTINTKLNTWLYSEHEDDPLTPDIEPSIDFGPGTEVAFVPSGQYRLLNKVLQDPLPTDFTTEGWRECYQLDPAIKCGT